MIAIATVARFVLFDNCVWEDSNSIGSPVISTDAESRRSVPLAWLWDSRSERRRLNN
jgi:hypothetical protein